MGMDTDPTKVEKVKATLALTKEAQEVMLVNGYATERTQGDFISMLILAHHARQTRQLTPVEIVQELARLVDLLAQSAVAIADGAEAPGQVNSGLLTILPEE